MTSIHFFGVSTPVGQSFKELLYERYKTKNIFFYSRLGDPYIKYDLQKPNKSIIKNIKSKSVIISFAPIWHLSFFFKYLISLDQKILKNIDSVIVLSSTSVLSKKFSSNNFDKNLYKKLKNSENNLSDLARKSKFKLAIIRPTLIYGKIYNYSDQNISIIRKFMTILPVIFLPKDTGLRQPIHIGQLSEVTYQIYEDLKKIKKKYELKIIEVGGDISLSYFDMLCSVRGNLLKNNKIKYCKIIKIPNKIFYLFTFPVYLLSPKIFESLLRIQSNLSGFETYSNITKKNPLPFPAENI